MYRIPFYRWINLLQKRLNMCHSLTWDQRIPTAAVTAQINSSQHTPGQRISNITHESLHTCRTYAVRPSSILSSRLVTFSRFTQSHVPHCGIRWCRYERKSPSSRRIWAWQFSHLRTMLLRVDCWCFMLLMIASLQPFVCVMFPLQFN